MRFCLCVRRSGFRSDGGIQAGVHFAAAPSLYRGYVDGGGFILWKCAGRVRKTSRMIGRKRNSDSRALLAIGQSLCYDKAKNAEKEIYK